MKRKPKTAEQTARKINRNKASLRLSDMTPSTEEVQRVAMKMVQQLITEHDHRTGVMQQHIRVARAQRQTLEAKINEQREIIKAIRFIRAKYAASIEPAPVNPKSQFECYWSRRALAAEKELAKLKSKKSRRGKMTPIKKLAEMMFDTLFTDSYRAKLNIRGHVAAKKYKADNMERITAFLQRARFGELPANADRSIYNKAYGGKK
jgi:hypothetical protein